VPIGMVTVILTIRISYRYSGTYTSTKRRTYKGWTAAVNNTFSLYYSKPNEINRQNYKDIRYYEIKPKDFTGDFNGIIGNVYQITNGTNSIGQRIARKLSVNLYLENLTTFI
jgi:hypothetical protein